MIGFFLAFAICRLSGTSQMLDIHSTFAYLTIVTLWYNRIR
jgi:hypothetical protein